VQYRLKKTQIIPSTERAVDVQVVKKPNEILKSQVVVTITDTYNVPLVGFFGVDGKLSIKATGRADCVDYLEYLYGVEAIADPENSPIDVLPDSDTCIVTFVKSEPSGGFHAAQPVLRGKTMIASNRHTHCEMPKDPEFNGMRFMGWVTKDGRNFSANVEVADHMTVYGTWECKITFDPTGGTVNPTTKTVGYMKKTTFPRPEKYSFQFLGWYSDVEYSENYKSNNGTGTRYVDNVTEIPGNITLYARWECTHADFTYTLKDAGNCKTPSTWIRDCKFCDYTDEAKGDFGVCQMGAPQITTSPGCTSSGWSITKCKFCGKLMAEGSVPALDHLYASGKKAPYDKPYSKAATCYEEGRKGSMCSRCGAIEGNTIPKLSHNFDSGTVIKNATCGNVGTKRYRCKNAGCSAYRDEDIAKLAHTWNGRCGKIHNISNNPLNMNKDPWDQTINKPSIVHRTSNGYRYSTRVECYLCSVCGEPYNGWTNRKDVDGVPIAWGVICKEHRDNDGIVEDKAYKSSDHVNMHVHG